MRILMLGNSFTTANHMPQMLAELTGAEVVHHTRGGTRLSEHLNPVTRLGARTRAALRDEQWDYVILQEMSNGPVTAPERFLGSVGELCHQIRQNGAEPILYATWAYRKNSAKLAAMGMDYDIMFQQMYNAYHRAAEQNHALIADVGQQFYELSDVQDLYAADGVHPNVVGSRIAAERIAAVIQNEQIASQTLEEPYADL